MQMNPDLMAAAPGPRLRTEGEIAAPRRRAAGARARPAAPGGTVLPLLSYLVRLTRYKVGGGRGTPVAARST
jgi:hypothetical protein